MQEQAIRVARTARYFQLGELTESIEQVWFVCHGYGQLAKYFIRNFTCLADKKTVIIAPEALSRFYLEGFAGRVGASWMTSEDRLSEIEDYIGYLNELYNKVTEGEKNSSLKVTVLGFSQGAATASRWIVKGVVKPVQLILWAGTPPAELISKEALSNLKLSLVYGKDDEFIRPEKLREVKELFDKNDIQFHNYVFEGGHNLDEKILLKLKI